MREKPNAVFHNQKWDIVFSWKIFTIVSNIRTRITGAFYQYEFISFYRKRDEFLK